MTGKALPPPHDPGSPHTTIYCITFPIPLTNFFMFNHKVEIQRNKHISDISASYENKSFSIFLHFLQKFWVKV